MPAGRGSREWWTALALVGAFVLGRSAVFVIYEHAYFDSDQAIVGLMATHLAEGRAFPLFFYGQTYMLGVEAWLAAPWMLAFGSSVASLRMSLVLTNLLVAWLLVGFLCRSAGLRPFLAVLVTVFFTLAPPFTSAQLVEAQGGNIEPFLYVILLWWLRKKPWPFGAVLAVGVLNREFTLYAVPVLVAGQFVTRELGWRDGARQWLIVAISFVVVREGIHALMPLADLMGPGTRGELVGGYAGSQLSNLAGRVAVSPLELPARLWSWLTRDLPSLVGGVRIEGGVSAQGRGWVGWLLGVGALAAVVRIGYLARLRPERAAWAKPAFAWYLLGIGVLSAVGYVLSRPVEAPVPRYYLLALLAPVGLSGVWLALEPRRYVRHGLAALVCVWAVGSATDNARYARAFVEGRVPNEMREVADGLIEQDVRVARATYWTAYELTFLTHERVRIASTDFVRISEYQEQADESAGPVPVVTERACAGGRPVGPWWLCPG